MTNSNPRFDIRDRDINARALYDPRFDKKRKVNNQPPVQKAASGMQPPAPDLRINQPESSLSIRQPQTQPAAQPQSPQRIPVIPYTPPAAQTPAPQPAAQPQPVQQRPAPQSTTRRIVTGDSVATGIGHGGARGDATTDAAWGRGSNEQLNFMRSKGPEYYRGADVVLSSGVLNSGDIPSVEEQIKFLVRSGAKSIRLAGAPNTGRFAYLNPVLQELAQKYGIQFIGSYASQDGIHPFSYTNYK